MLQTYAGVCIDASPAMNALRCCWQSGWSFEGTSQDKRWVDIRRAVSIAQVWHLAALLTRVPEDGPEITSIGADEYPIRVEMHSLEQKAHAPCEGKVIDKEALLFMAG